MIIVEKTRPIITSTANQSVKCVKRVRDGKESGTILIEGARLFGEALSSGVVLTEMFLTERFFDANAELFDESDKSIPKLTFVSENVLKAMSETPSPQGVIALADRPAHHLTMFTDRLKANKKGIIVYLHNVSNPANLGAVIRTAEAAGALGIVTSDNSTDPFSPSSLRGSMGSAFRLPVIESVSIDKAAEFARQNQMLLSAVDIKGSTHHTNIDWNTPKMLIFGSEAHGLTADILEIADELVSIEMEKPVESLNLAVSCGIILFEARRQAF